MIETATLNFGTFEPMEFNELCELDGGRGTWNANAFMNTCTQGMVSGAIGGAVAGAAVGSIGGGVVQVQGQ